MVVMDISISDFHKNFYISWIQKLKFHFPHVRILGTQNYGKKYREALKHQRSFQDVLFQNNYVDLVVDILKTKFNHNIMVAVDILRLNS